MTTIPSQAEFVSTARREFGFLVSEFGFTEQPDTRAYPNPFSVHYSTSATAVTAEGINWGFGVQVMLHAVSPHPGTPSQVPLWALVEHRDPQESQVPSGQLAQLAHYASLLRLHAADVLRGDFAAFPAAMRVVDFHAAELDKPKERKLP